MSERAGGADLRHIRQEGQGAFHGLDKRQGGGGPVTGDVLSMGREIFLGMPL
jgi:hypothetical protein